ncbi:hypothetical protein Tco_0234403 [Tanacetum coccineum]
MLDRTDFESWQQRIRPERARVFTDLSAKEKERYKADIRATNILLQGIQKDIYTLINHYTDAKDIWDNVKMILEGSELTKHMTGNRSKLKNFMEKFIGSVRFGNDHLGAIMGYVEIILLVTV